MNKNNIKVSSIPQVVEKPGFKVIGTSCETTMDEKDIKIPRLVSDFQVNRIADIHNRINAPRSYGIFVDPPGWNPDTEPFTWIAAVEVDNLDFIPEGMVWKALPAHQYATLSYNPSVDEMDPYQFLHGWIKENGYHQLGSFGFEMYEQYTGPDTEYTLYLPVGR
ncbi:GyrI-like domain-containing protein [Thalassobacillus pellis]|uniref:GyrI-like domain-containing protein n=1 Tax=Thalassobacillus pellis TaxID=748008 RepID=UPI001962138F|nr:effector binding domain-containing protein [Thalassobacillus pellis]MBM7554249.1 putative transcriptional regulator YdeE [Thalassobacillus pellis]